ncbi:FxLYD domain-containing protein [Kitasatospora sp. NPDC093679]|uniref:FxLYD domain-containing protein n=1 Tax=Kitasatospora sp. NPDC093679 TaxID=3154983 RepID=UPI003412DD36
MRPITLALATACLLAGAVACEPPADSSTQKSTAAAVPAQPAAGAPSAAAPPAAGDAAAPAPAGDGDKAKDVEITKCSVDPTLHWPSAELTITNHSSKASNYMVQVEFLDGAGTRIGEGMAATNGLAPNQKSVQKAQGTSTAAGKTSCRLIEVTRYATP